MTEHFIYILETVQGPYYIGYTTDIKKRMLAHQSGKGSKLVRAFKFKKLVYQECYSSKSEALKREAELKTWKRSKKETLIRKKGA